MSVIDLATYAYNLELNDKGFTSGMQKADKTATGFQGKLTKFTSFLKTGLKAGLVAAGAAISGLAVKGTKDFLEFENSMNEVFTMLPGITDNAMKQMQDQVKDFSAEMGVVTKDVVPALYQSLSAGVPKDNVFEFLEVANKAAIGGIAELETAVDGISSVVNAYGSDVLEAGEASDLMFTAIRLGKTNFDELSSSLYNVIPTASALGVEFGDVTAGLAAMTAQGTPTSVVTTQLRQMFVELSKEGNKTSDVFKQISGKSFKDFIAEGGNVQDALQILEKYAKDSNLGINDLFGSVEAGNAALALTGKGTEAFSKALDEMGNSAGATDAAFNQMDQGIGRSLDKLKAQFGVILLDIGEQLAPAVSKFVSFMEQNMPQIREILNSIITNVGIAINTVITIVDPIFTFIANLISSFQSFADENDATFGKIKDTITSVLDSICDYINAYTQFIKNIWDKYGENILTITKKWFNMTATNIESVLGIIRGIFDFFSGLFTGDWEKMGKALCDIVSNAWGIITNIFTSAIDIITDILGLAVKVLLNLGKSMMQGLWNGIKVVWSSITSWFSNVFDNLFGWFDNQYSKFKNIGSNLLNSVWNGLKDKWSSISSWFNNTVSWIKDKLSFWSASQSRMPSTYSRPNMPVYDVGTPFVPNDQLALVHKGEMIVPAKYNPYNPKSNVAAINPTVNNRDFNLNINISKLNLNDKRQMDTFYRDLQSSVKTLLK